MEKRLRLKLATTYGQAVSRDFPGFAQWAEKTFHLFAGKTVWCKDEEGLSYFIILSPEPKGWHDSVAVELGWSRRHRFPELFQRPSLVWVEESARPAQHPEGTMRLGRLDQGRFDFVDVTAETVAETADFLGTKLRELEPPSFS